MELSNFTPAEIAPETPYLLAKQEWDVRIGSSVLQAYNWRKIAFGLMLITSMLIIALIISNCQPKYIPYIVEITQKEVTNITKALTTSYQPDEQQIKYYLIKFVEKIRGLSLDREVNQKWLKEAYSLLTPKTAHKFDAYFANPSNPMFRKLKAKETIVVEVEAFTKITSNLYQLQWLEVTYDALGKILSQEKFTGFATIKIAAPSTEQAILHNPLGIWLLDFSWSKALHDG